MATGKGKYLRQYWDDEAQAYFLVNYMTTYPDGAVIMSGKFVASPWDCEEVDETPIAPPDYPPLTLEEEEVIAALYGKDPYDYYEEEDLYE